MQKGQCIARLWPVGHIYNPSKAYQATVNAIKREREIEKRMSLADTVALKLRTVQSRYNWWEMLGKIHISREYHTPGSTCGIYFLEMRIFQGVWQIAFESDRPTIPELHFFPKTDYPRPGHYWYDVTHREGGLENTLRGGEAFNPTKKLLVYSQESGKTVHGFRLAQSYIPAGAFFILKAYSDTPGKVLIGESGLFRLTVDNPWWLNAPL